MLDGRNAPEDDGRFLGSPSRPVCCAITPLGATGPSRLRRLVRQGVEFIQLRDRAASDRAFERFLDRLAAEAPEVLPRVLVNDRLALALAFPVAGVHLPEAGLPVAAVRSRFGPRLLIGRSVHSAGAAERSGRQGADYLILGAAAPTAGKSPQPAGVFAEACRRSPVPVWAVGGLQPETLQVLAGSGVSGIAAIRSFAGAERAGTFREAIRKAGRGRLFVGSSAPRSALRSAPRGDRSASARTRSRRGRPSPVNSPNSP